MGWIDRLLGRATAPSPAASATRGIDLEGIELRARSVNPFTPVDGQGSLPRGGETPVPLRVFREYQTETSRRLGELSHQYQEVVKRNHGLQLAVNEFSRRLDSLQAEQAKLRKDTEHGLVGVRHEVARMRVESDPEQRARMQSAKSALSAIQPTATSHDRRSEPSVSRP